ncbi:hypothetical protein OGY61_17550 [Citrobacter sp. CK196]|uniref:hypothetical protein n=1 Tax=Citrobacter sp. CK196 TaxID=2985105 RepID=UPI0025758CBC|nr:hypothetical protein [Citrobacter sp. CK196]MDM2987654.1 hypothetical protein [Citrobacter sp. CK196]
MTTITRERMKEIRDFDTCVTLEESAELARIALASLDAGSNNHPAHGPLSNGRLHRIREILGKAAAQSDGGNIGYAMSDAVKAIDELLDVRKAEPVAFINGAWTLVYYRPPKESGLKIGDKLYTAPPAPVAIDERAEFNAWNNEDNLPIAGVGAKNAAWLAWQARARLGSPTAPVVPDECPVKIRDLMASHSDALFHDGDAQEIWNACRAAMLNHSGDVIEMEAIKQQSTMQPNNGAMSGDAVKQSSSNAQRR